MQLYLAGYGVDLRERDVWSTFRVDCADVNLHAMTLDPSSAEWNAGLPAATWLIGNHNDELTPWMPILAARYVHILIVSFKRRKSCSSQPRANVVILPCCAHDLYGKYAREQTQSVHGASVYQNYVNFVMQLCKGLPCFKSVKLDKMRIPSTKSLCIIARQTTEMSAGEIDACV